jgi:hypothetical protein
LTAPMLHLVYSATLLDAAAQAALPPRGADRLVRVIEHIEVKEGPDGIGGPTILDAVDKLRTVVDFPVCLEEVEYDPAFQTLTLAAALAKLRDLRAKGTITPLDAIRLERYEALVRTVDDPAQFALAIWKGQCPLSASNVTIREFLDRLTRICPEYVWSDKGDEEGPIVLIRPRHSALEWPATLPCGEKRAPESPFAPDARFLKLLAEHSILLLSLGAYQAPPVALDLCRDGLTAQDVLIHTTRADRKSYWNLGGVKGSRFLVFGSVTPK